MIREVRQLLSAIFLALASLALLLGGFSLTLAEGGRRAAAATVTPTLTPEPVIVPPSSEQPGQPPAPTDTPAPIPTLVPPTNCPPPTGWVPYSVRAGDTLEMLAARHNLRVEDLVRGNCLTTEGVVAGLPLYVPALPTATRIPCGPPAGWVQNYTVQKDDNLYRIGLKYRVTAVQLQIANCIADIDVIDIGQRLWVPNVSTSTPAVTATATATATLSPTATATATATLPPTATPTATPTASDPPTATSTPVTPASPPSP